MDSHISDEKALNIVNTLLAADPASKLLGIAIDNVTYEQCQISMIVSNKMTNGYDLCHGGFIFTLADTALAFACATKGQHSVTTNAQIEYINPAKLHDELVATAKVTLDKGRHLYCDIEITNQDQSPIALCRGHQVILN